MVIEGQDCRSNGPSSPLVAQSGHEPAGDLTTTTAISSATDGQRMTAVLLDLNGIPADDRDPAKRDRLGFRRLCLGNGPTSEVGGIESVRFDCLLQVNLIWNGRGIHRDLEVVFPADL